MIFSFHIQTYKQVLPLNKNECYAISSSLKVCQKPTESYWFFSSKKIKFWEQFLSMAFLFTIIWSTLYQELGSNDNFLHKLGKIYEADIGPILNSSQSYLVLNVESEIQILISFQHIALVHTDCNISINAQVLHTWFAK